MRSTEEKLDADFRLELLPKTNAYEVLSLDTISDPATERNGIAMRCWPTRPSPVAIVTRVSLGPCRLLGIRFPPSLFEGRLTGDFAMIAFGMTDTHLSRMGGRALPPSSAVVGRPGARMRAHWPDEQSGIQTAVVVAMPDAMCPWGHDEGTSETFAMRTIPAEQLRTLRRRATTLFLQAAFEPGSLATDASRNAAATTLLRDLSAAVATWHPLPDPTPALTASYEDAVDRIDALIAGRLGGPILLDDIAAELGMAPRTVHNVMKRMRGMTLQAYVKVFKMQSVRFELLHGAGVNLVKQAAIRHGFMHQGRFAQDYTKYFGEPPSATLARRGATTDASITTRKK